MKRYMLFTFDSDYPQGGMDDFKKSFDTLEECKEYFKLSHDDNMNVFDIEKRISVCYGYKNTHECKILDYDDMEKQ